MTMRNLSLSFCLLFLFLGTLHAQLAYLQDENCFTIVAGKEATADGSVMLAHNEDGPGRILINWYRVPPRTESSNTFITTETQVRIPSEEGAGLLWLEMPGYSFSDSYMNDHGVVIASNQCRSREDNASLTGGGIGYWLRRLMAERARTAREAVITGGKLVEAYGYLSSGRSYCIADTAEAWMMAVVKGRHWVACRIPDDRVAVLPNYYTIDAVDLSDTINCLGSADLITYAARRGWYDTTAGRPFSFRLAYADTSSLADMRNIARHWQGVNLLAEQRYALEEPFPFTFRPAEKVSAPTLFDVLGDHYEETDLQPSRNSDPHVSDTMRICSARNQYGFVAQLRSRMPVAVGAVLWLALPRPCMQPFIPWYCGIVSVPPVYSDHNAAYAISCHFDTVRAMQDPCHHAYCTFLDYADRVNGDYAGKIARAREYKNRRQADIGVMKKEMEARVLPLYESNPGRALKMLTDFTSSLAMEEYRHTSALLKEGR